MQISSAFVLFVSSNTFSMWQISFLLKIIQIRKELLFKNKIFKNFHDYHPKYSYIYIDNFFNIFPLKFFQVFLTMALSGTYTLARPSDHTVGKKRLKSSPVIKNIAKTVYKRSVSSLVDKKLLDTTFEIGLSKFEAIKAIELAILRMLSTQIDALTAHVQKSDVLDVLNSPVNKFITEEVLNSLLSGKDEKNISPFNTQQQPFDEAWLREDNYVKIPMIHENTGELPSMKPSFEKEEESLPATGEEFLV